MWARPRWRVTVDQVRESGWHDASRATLVRLHELTDGNPFFALEIADDPLAWLAAGTLSLSALLGYLVSRSIGLPSMADDVGEWLNPLGIAAALCETMVAALTLGHRGARRYTF